MKETYQLDLTEEELRYFLNTLDVVDWMLKRGRKQNRGMINIFMHNQLKKKALDIVATHQNLQDTTTFTYDNPYRPKFEFPYKPHDWSRVPKL